MVPVCELSLIVFAWFGFRAAEFEDRFYQIALPISDVNTLVFTSWISSSGGSSFEVMPEQVWIIFKGFNWHGHI